MFELLMQKEPKCDDLILTYLVTKEMIEELQVEHDEAHSAYILAEKDLQDPEKTGSKGLDQARSRLEEAVFRLDAVRSARHELKNVLAERLPIEARERLNEIDKKLEGLYQTIPSAASIIHDLTMERTCLEKLIQSGDPKVEVERILSAFANDVENMNSHLIHTDTNKLEA